MIVLSFSICTSTRYLSIISANQILHRALTVAQCQTPSFHDPNFPANKYPSSSPTQENSPRHAGHEGVTDGSKVGSNASINRTSELQQGDRIMPSVAKMYPRACGARKYDCSCHQTGISRRFLSLQYTPLSCFIGKLSDRPSGCRCIGLRLRVALSMYGVPIAIVAGIGFMVDGAGFELRPALRAETIVSYTSPGFETIWRLQRSLISLEEARGRLVELHQSDSSFRHHKDPAGNTYIHVSYTQFHLNLFFTNCCRHFCVCHGIGAKRTNSLYSIRSSPIAR